MSISLADQDSTKLSIGDPTVAENRDQKVRHEWELIPGYERDEDGEGHRQDSPQGKIWIRNLRQGDDIFESEMFGSLNITGILRALESMNCKTCDLPIGDLLRNTSLRYYDQKHALGLSAERLATPILVGFSATGLEVIDGVHRIRRRAALAMPNVFGYFVSPRVIRSARITRKLCSDDGTWTANDTMMDEDFDNEMRKAENFINKVPFHVLGRLSGMSVQ